jgi:hypothetical protein
MRQRQNEQMTDLAIVERELAGMKDSIKPYAELESEMNKQAQAIELLKSQLHEERVAHADTRSRYSQQIRRREGLEYELRQSEGKREQNKKAAEQEKASRLEAERKLKEYVEAQKRMAARFA